jgi:endonuclease YncB( thermonuclease family)
LIVKAAFLFLILFFSSAVLFADAIRGRVVGITDGDTVVVLTKEKKQVKIRLNCIDAPEKNQDFGQRAKQSLSDMIFGKDVEVVVHDTDKYGRTVGTIYLNGVDINLEQVKKGMAWVYSHYCKDPAYYKAWDIAKKNKVGLWSQSNPVEPSKFRRDMKSKSKTGSNIIDTSPKNTTANFKCGTKVRCSQMTSCKEAQFYFKVCGVKELDANGDGIPCNSLCRTK